MNKLIEIEEREKLITESERIKEYEKIILNSNLKKYKKEIKQQEIKNIWNEYDKFIQEEFIDFCDREAIKKFIQWQIMKVLEG